MSITMVYWLFLGPGLQETQYCWKKPRDEDLLKKMYCELNNIVGSSIQAPRSCFLQFCSAIYLIILFIYNIQIF